MRYQVHEDRRVCHSRNVPELLVVLQNYTTYIRLIWGSKLLKCSCRYSIVFNGYLYYLASAIVGDLSS